MSLVKARLAPHPEVVAMLADALKRAKRGESDRWPCGCPVTARDRALWRMRAIAQQTPPWVPHG